MITPSWIVDPSFSTRLTLALLHFLWQGCCGGIVVVVGGVLLRRATARSRYSLNVAAMLFMAVCLPVTYFLVDIPDAAVDQSAFPQFVRNAQVSRSTADANETLSAAQIVSSAPELTSTSRSVADANSTAEAGATPVVAGESGVRPQNLLSAMSSTLTAGTFQSLSRWVTVLYLSGVALILGRLLRGVWGGRRLRKLANVIDDAALLEIVGDLARRLGFKEAPTIAWCEQISIPVVVGIVKPMILLPMAIVSGLTPHQLQALMLHELAHIRHFDPIVNLCQRIIEAVLFFHPIVWFVSRRISVEREHAADDIVLAAGWERPIYADALVRVAELASAMTRPNAARRATVLGASGSNPTEFKLRVLRLLGDSHPPKLELSRVGILVTVLFAAMGGILAWSQTSKQEQTSPMIEAGNVRDAEPIDTVTKPPESLKELDQGRSLVAQAKPNPASEPGAELVPAPIESPVTKEVQPLQGHWAVESCESETAKFKVSEWAARRWRWSIKGDEITWGREGQEWRMSYKIDAATTPHQIDLTFLDGPHKGQTCLGIYEWSGDEGKILSIRIQDPGAMVERPTDFTWKAGSQTSRIVLRSIPLIDPVKELASFQGTWCWDFSQPWTWPQPIGVGTDSDGRKSEKRWVIDGNRITWVGRDGQRVDVTFTIDPFKAPKQIEFTFIEGPHKGKKSIGIYEPVDGHENHLWLCMTDPGADAPRPTDISAGGLLKQSMISIYKVDPPKPAVTKELEPFQGFWEMGLCDTVNKTLYLPNDELPKRRWFVTGNQIVWSQKGEEWRLQFKVDPSKSPKEFEFKYLSGPFAGKTCLGMYEFGGVGKQSLQIAIQDPGANVPRPTRLSMTGSSQTGLIFLSPMKVSEAERELASFQGIWTLRNFDTGNFSRNKDPSSWPLPGGKGPDKSGDGSELRWTIKGKEITWTSPSGQEIKASFTIDTQQRPRQIDLTFLSGPDKGEACPGIFQRDDLDENILWLCLADPGSKAVRPNEFSYQWGKGRSVLSFYPFEPSSSVPADTRLKP